MLLVVVASRYDESARRLVARWGGARVLTPADLSRPGWHFVSGEAEGSTAVVDGAVVPAREVGGVLTRLPSVGPEELPHIVAEERQYVAAEMTAFLTAWLAELPCRVVNRPTALCLAGPAWRREQWVRAAASVGLEVVPAVRDIPAGEVAAGRVPQTVAVPVIAGTCTGVDESCATGLRRLAGAAGVELFTAYLTSRGPGARFVSADLWPPIDDGDVAGAIRAALAAPRGETP